MNKTTVLIGISLMVLQLPVSAGSWRDTSKSVLDGIVNSDTDSATTGTAAKLLDLGVDDLSVQYIKADLTEHKINKGMNGMFYYLAKEEAAIRKDPVKQTTALLKKIFGQQASD
jgi:hypothetical protein